MQRTHILVNVIATLILLWHCGVNVSENQKLYVSRPKMVHPNAETDILFGGISVWDVLHWTIWRENTIELLSTIQSSPPAPYCWPHVTFLSLASSSISLMSQKIGKKLYIFVMRKPQFSRLVVCLLLVTATCSKMIFWAEHHHCHHQHNHHQRHKLHHQDHHSGEEEMGRGQRVGMILNCDPS